MTPFEHTLARFREAVAGPAADVPLARAALLIAQAEQPDLDIEVYEQRLLAIAEPLHERIAAATPGASAPEPVAALNELLFVELGFAGDEQHYADPRNLLLHELLDRRRGIPVTLAILHVEVARAAGIALQVVGLPGHVVTRLKAPADGSAPRFFDPFRGGRELSAEQCQRMVRAIYGRRSPFRDHYLEPISARQTLQRVLHNLKAGALREGDEDRASRAIELLLVLFPWDLDEIRDRGMLRERLGQYPDALDDLQQYVRHRAGARDIRTVAETVRSLQRHTEADAS